MDCFELPNGHTAHCFQGPDELLSVGSGMVGIVDETNVDAFLAANARVIRGRRTTGPKNYILDGNGFLCDTGGDGGFPFTAFIHGPSAYAIEIYCDDPDTEHDRWIPAGIIPAHSGTLVIGDPGLLHEYMPDHFEPPVAALGAWTLLALPGPGWVALHISKHNGAVESPNVVLRTNWLPSDPPANSPNLST